MRRFCYGTRQAMRPPSDHNLLTPLICCRPPLLYFFGADASSKALSVILSKVNSEKRVTHHVLQQEQAGAVVLVDGKASGETTLQATLRYLTERQPGWAEPISEGVDGIKVCVCVGGEGGWAAVALGWRTGAAPRWQFLTHTCLCHARYCLPRTRRAWWRRTRLPRPRLPRSAR